MKLSELIAEHRVFYFFNEISRIPHGSGNTGRISAYLAEFARERGLSYKQEEIGNVIIFKGATPGYEQEEALILQGHMDMVAVKKPGAAIDMKTEGVKLRIEGDNLYAEDTSLGGDDGIAVAYALAILDADAIAHPRLEVVFTVDEETGMDGARELDASVLTGKRLLNIDSEEEGILLAGCAGGARVDWQLPVTSQEQSGLRCRLAVKGLAGGHSGVEIQKERGNAVCILGRVLYRLFQEDGISLERISGGLADNAIPREAEAQLVLHGMEEGRLQAALSDLEQALRDELRTKDPGVTLTMESLGDGRAACLTRESAGTLLGLLNASPNGVQAMSADVHGLVETSLNLGILETVDESKEIRFHFSVRSSIESAKECLIGRLESLAVLAGAAQKVRSAYPGWAYRKESPFRERAIAVYEELYGKTPKVEAIHAGLECGYLSAKIPGLECVSLGPDMQDIHTTEEKLSISSTLRVWEYLICLMKTKHEGSAANGFE